MEDWATCGAVLEAKNERFDLPAIPATAGTGGKTPNFELRARARSALSGQLGNGRTRRIRLASRAGRGRCGPFNRAIRAIGDRGVLC